MGKIFSNKNLIIKIATILVIVILFNFINPGISFGAVSGGIGGVLFEPIKDLVLAIGDGIVNIMQNVIFGTDVSLLKLEHSTSNVPVILGAIGGAIAGTISIIVGVAGAPFTGGLSLGAVAAGLSIFGTTVVAAGATAFVVSYVAEQALPQDFYLPMYAISPYEIFANKVAMLDVNFFQPNKYDEVDTMVGEEGKEQKSSAAELQGTIAKWYVSIRNFAVVVMMIILVYVGIRIVMSSAAEDRAKYKQRLMDWIIAMCLLFFMHYLMTLAVTITESLLDSIDTANEPYYVRVGSSDGKLGDYRYNVVILPKDGEENSEPQKEQSKVFDTDEGSLAQAFREQGVIVPNDDTGSGEYFVWPTNLMGKARVELQLEPTDRISDDDILARKFGFTIIFIALVIYTIMFLFRYLKRLIMLAFLTIIAPFVAMTYPLDKISDGSAQAFNMWVKEYVFNLLIQPVHLILYTILIGSAIDFAADNLLYALAALGFMLPAEKIMRKFFGFEKASTLDNGSALGGALAMQGINQLRRIGFGGSKKGAKGGTGGNATPTSKINKFNNRPPDKGKSPSELLASGEGQGLDAKSVGIAAGGQAVSDNGIQASLNGSEGEPMYRTSAEGMRIKEDMAAARQLMDEAKTDEERNIARQMMNDVRESDSRGVGQYLHDKMQESAFGRAITSAAGAPVRFTSNAVNGAREMAGKAVRRAVPKPIRTSVRGASAVLGAGAKYVAPRAAKLAVRGTVAGAAAMGGIAAGLVSEDYANVAKWGAAGAGAGWIAGGGLGQVPGKLEETRDSIVDAAQKGDTIYTLAAKGDKAEKERQKKISDAMAMKDKGRRDLYSRKLNVRGEKLNEVLKDSQKFRESGVTNDDIIIKAMKLDGFGDGRVSKEKIILAGLAEQVNGERKALEYIKKGLKEKGLSDNDIKKYADGISDIYDWNA